MTIAVAHSATAEGDAALRVAIREARARDVDLVFLNAVADRHIPGVQERYASLVQQRLRDFDAQQVRWTSQVVGGGDTDVPDALLRAIDETGAEMLILGTKRRSMVGKFILGHAVQQLLLDAPVPVMVTHPGR